MPLLAHKTSNGLMETLRRDARARGGATPLLLGEEPLSSVLIREDLGFKNTPTHWGGRLQEFTSIRGALNAAANES